MSHVTSCHMPYQVTIMKLPLKFHLFHQLMDMSIISTWKLKYQAQLFREIAADMEYPQQWREFSAVLQIRMKVLSEGHDPHLLGIAKIVKKSWTDVTEMTIYRFHVKSDMLPCPTSDELSVTYGRVQNTVRHDVVKENIRQTRPVPYSSLEDCRRSWRRLLFMVRRKRVNFWCTGSRLFY